MKNKLSRKTEKIWVKEDKVFDQFGPKLYYIQRKLDEIHLFYGERRLLRVQVVVDET